MSDYVYGPPTDGKPFKLAMGLRTLDPAQWLEGGPDLLDQLTERSELIAQKRELIYGTIPGHNAEINYFVEEIRRNLEEFHSAQYEVKANSIRHLESGYIAELDSPDPLLELSRVVAEDLCVLKRIDGAWTLIAGAVLFPSRWKLSEKLGKSLDRIHAPVPGYTCLLYTSPSPRD